MKLYSWNVNGFRAVIQKPEWAAWFNNNNADIVALQETKAEPAQVPDEHRAPQGRHAFWSAATVKRGYSGVAVFAAVPPLHRIEVRQHHDRRTSAEGDGHGAMQSRTTHTLACSLPADADGWGPGRGLGWRQTKGRAVDITIGIQNVARELSIEVDEEPAELTRRAAEAIRAGEPLTLEDAKGQTVVVPAGALGYLIVGTQAGRRVGFGL